jgi:hypothetical protein
MAEMAQWQKDLIAGSTGATTAVGDTTVAGDTKTKKRWTPFRNIQQGLGFFGGKPGGFLANKEQRDTQNLVEAAIDEPTTQWGQNLANTGSAVDPNAATETSATEEEKKGISPWWNLLYPTGIGGAALTIDRMFGGPISRSMTERKLAKAEERVGERPPLDVPFQWAKMFTHDKAGNELSPEIQKKYKDAYHQYRIDKEAGLIEGGMYDPPGRWGKGKAIPIGERYNLYDELGDPINEVVFREKIKTAKAAVTTKAKALEDKRSRRREAGFKAGSSYLKEMSGELMQPFEYKEF